MFHIVLVDYGVKKKGKSNLGAQFQSNATGSSIVFIGNQSIYRDITYFYRGLENEWGPLYPFWKFH